MGSIIGAKSATLGSSFHCTFFSHHTALGFDLTVPAAGSALTMRKRLFHIPLLEGSSASRQQKTRSWFEDGWRARK
jgi:hypothetical protein